MKSMDEYAAELDRRIDEKKNKLKARRRRITAACTALAVFVCAFGAWRVIKKSQRGTIDPVPGKRVETETPVTDAPTVIDPVPGKSAELPVDTADRFVLGNTGYDIDVGKPLESDRLQYTGLIAFERDGEALFTELENGPIYSIKNGSVGYTLGTLPVGAWYGAAYHDGGVYMPATSEVICGLVRSNGVCRYDLDSRQTECVIASNDRAGSVLIDGETLIYAANGERRAVIKLCSLASGRIFRLAELDFTGPDEEYPGDARIVRWGGGLAVLYGGRVSSVSFDGTVKTIAEEAEAICAGGERLFVFYGVETEKHYETQELPMIRRNAEQVEVWSAETGERLASFDIGEYTLCCNAEGPGASFAVHNGRLAALKNGELLLVDPVGGGAEKLHDGMPGYADAVSLGNRLLVLYDHGYKDGSFTGRVLLTEADGPAFSGELPAAANTHREERLTFSSVAAAQAALNYETVDIPVAFDKLGVSEIFGWESVNTSYVFGERREKIMGWIRIEAEYNGKRLGISIEQTPRNAETDFALKLGYGLDIERMLFGAESLPVSQQCPDGVLWYDLVRENGEPIGIMMWFEDPEGCTVDIEARLLRETPQYSTVIYISSSELTAGELRELFCR